MKNRILEVKSGNSKMTGKKTIKNCKAFVLGGGGSRGALQVGALRALFEAGIKPDLLTGSSIGAANATGLALWGLDENSLDKLEAAWETVSSFQLLDPKAKSLLLRAMVGLPSDRTVKKMEELLHSLGITHELKFCHIDRVKLYIISSDIETGQLVIHGEDDQEPILSSLISSAALPPWIMPIRNGDQLIIDGGYFSNLPIEPALRMGATEIIALDLDDDSLISDEESLSTYLAKFTYGLSRRHIYLEKALAEAHGVHVRSIEFRGLTSRPLWDFSNYKELIQAGYEKASKEISKWRSNAHSEQNFSSEQ